MSFRPDFAIYFLYATRRQTPASPSFSIIALTS
jgi:hypothetical protein